VERRQIGEEPSQLGGFTWYCFTLGHRIGVDVHRYAFAGEFEAGSVGHKHKEGSRRHDQNKLELNKSFLVGESV